MISIATPHMLLKHELRYGVNNRNTFPHSRQHIFISRFKKINFIMLPNKLLSISICGFFFCLNRDTSLGARNGKGDMLFLCLCVYAWKYVVCMAIFQFQHYWMIQQWPLDTIRHHRQVAYSRKINNSLLFYLFLLLSFCWDLSFSGWRFMMRCRQTLSDLYITTLFLFLYLYFFL